MILLGPRPFPLAERNIPLTMPNQPWTQQIPKGAPWYFSYLLINYPRNLGDEGLIQTSPDLSYTVFDARGWAFSVVPIFAPAVTTPAGGRFLGATHPIREPYAGGSVIRVQIDGFTGTPDVVSITLMGTRGWETMGGR